MRIFKRTHLKKERGQVMVELMLSIIFVMVVIFWAWELTMLVYTYTVMAAAAKEGVRYAVVHGAGNTVLCSSPCSGSCATNADCVITVVKGYAKYSGHDISAISVNVNYLDSTLDAPGRVQVVVSYVYRPYLNLGWSPPTIRANAEGRIVN